MGRRKIDITEVQDPNTKQVTFSKRRTGLFKKANELSILCGAEVAVIVFSPGNKPYSYAHPSVDAIANRFLRQLNAPNAAAIEDVDDDDDDDDDVDYAEVEMLSKHLSDLEAQIRKEEDKSKDLNEKLKLFEKTHVPQNDEGLQTSYVEFQAKVDDYLHALEVADYMLLLSEEPVVGGGKQDAKKRKTN